MKMEVEAIVRRIRDEVARQQHGHGAEQSASGVAVEGRLPVWATAMSPLPDKPAYTTGELLVYSDRAFVEAAYMAVLRRAADAEGLATNLQKLRSGEASKIEVLAQLRWSPEGRARGVHVDGLLAPYKLHQWRRKRYIGPLIRWAHAVMRLPALAERTARSEANQASEIHEMGLLLNRSSAQVDARLCQANASLATVAARLDSIEGDGRVHTHRLDSIESDGRVHTHRLDSIESDGRIHSQRLDAIKGDFDALVESVSGQVAKLAGALAAQETSARDQREGLVAGLALLREQLDAHGTALALIDRAKELGKEGERALDSFYVAFEERFRGSRDLIRERSMPYLDIVTAADAGTHDAPVLDLGCGRGDWLDILREHGLIARGVDSNQVFLQICRGRGLEVIQGDVLEVLRGLEDASVGAITGMHIAEHLPFEVLVGMLDEAKRVLRLGGVLALETPNPENLWVASHWFYMDPTHRNPLPPDALKWIVEARGFADARIERWTIARDMAPPPLLDPDTAGAASINVVLGLLHAAPDYAVIARRIQ